MLFLRFRLAILVSKFILRKINETLEAILSIANQERLSFFIYYRENFKSILID